MPVTTTTSLNETELESTFADVTNNMYNSIGDLTGAPIITEQTIEYSKEVVNKIPQDSYFSIRYIDVGQGDAALVECDGHYMLIDGGNKGDSSKIYSILRSSKIEKLDIVVASHPHEDHIGGLPGAFNYTSADLTLCPVTSYETDAFEDFLKYANKNGGGITVPCVGDTYTLGSSVVSILGVNSTSDPNNASIVMSIEYGDTTFLFTGDAEEISELAMLENNEQILDSTILKVGHHGSSSSSCYDFLKAVSPEVAVYSCGINNEYGHPHGQVVKRINNTGALSYRTDKQGNIVISTDGQKYFVYTQK
jgi:competence protein ComEC